MITKNTENIEKFVVVNSSFRYEKLKPFINRALKDFIYKYLSKEEYERLEAYSDTDTIIKEVVELTAEAEVNLAMYYYMNVAGIQITSAGVHVVSPQGQQSAPKQDLRDALRLYKKNGLSALDNLLELLEENEDKFPDWKTSKAYSKQKELLVNTTAEFQHAYNIFNSVQTFLSLVPELKRSELKYASPVVTNEVLKFLKTSPTTLNATQKEVFDQVKQYLQDAIVLFTVSSTLGSGMYMQDATGFQIRFDILDYERNFTNSKQLDQYIITQKESTEFDANQYLKEALKLIKANTDVFTTYVEPTKTTGSKYLASKGIVGI